MQDHVIRARRFRDRADECLRLAKSAIAAEVRDHYLTIATHYLTLAEVEERHSQTTARMSTLAASAG
jgi:hypothetical protein